MRQDQPLRPRTTRHVRRLGRQQMAAALRLGVVLREVAQSGLAQEEVSRVRQAWQRRARAGIGRVGQDPLRVLAIAAGADAKAPGADEVLGLIGLQAEVADLDRPFSVVLHEDKTLVEEVRVAGTQRKFGELGHGPRWHDHQQPLLGHVDPRIGVAQRHEIEAVVGVHVADDHRVQLVRRVAAQQLGHDPWAGVEHDSRAAALDQVAGAGLAGVGPGGAPAEDGDAHVGVGYPSARWSMVT